MPPRANKTRVVLIDGANFALEFLPRIISGRISSDESNSNGWHLPGLETGVVHPDAYTAR